MNNLKLGLCSVTFRKKSAAQVVEIAKKAGISYIEWGGDIHVKNADDAKIVKSIYAVDFSGSGKIKLAYNIKSASAYDENTVYYIAAEEIKSSYDQLSKHLDMLYKRHRIW